MQRASELCFVVSLAALGLLGLAVALPATASLSEETPQPIVSGSPELQSEGPQCQAQQSTLDAPTPIAMSVRECIVSIAGCGFSASSCVGLREGSPCGAGTCVSFCNLKVLQTVCLCQTTGGGGPGGDGCSRDSNQICDEEEPP